VNQSQPGKAENTMSDVVKERLFIGLKITNTLQRLLDECPAVYNVYYKDNNPSHLQIVKVDGTDFLGKTMDQGLPVNSINDITRNIKSILNKICPKYTVSAGEIKVFARTFIG
jgi:hypothetical protein